MARVPRLFATAVLGLSLSCAPQARPSDIAADESAIRAIVNDWNGYLKSQNDSAIGAIYDADGVLLPPGMPRVTGRDNIRQFWAGIWPIKASLELEPTSIRIAGEWAIEEGNWTWSSPAHAGEFKDNGKYLVTWRKTNGKWQAVQDIWNSDNPPPSTK
jgi:uncharacterized protein (TIGR02246 family)